MTASMRRLIRIVEGHETPCPVPAHFYHATPERNWLAIQRQGLMPSNPSAPVSAPRIYLGRQASLAEAYADNGFGTDEDEPWVILSIDGSQLDPAQLAPDLDHEFDMAWDDVMARGYTEEDIEYGNIPWWVSFKETGQCIYHAPIPPRALTMIKRIPLREERNQPRRE